LLLRGGSIPFQVRSDRRGGFCIPHYMKLEQQPPNKPNFLAVVLIFGAALIVLFLVALLVLHVDPRALMHGSFRRVPTSHLVLPEAMRPSSWLA
jgi:hypothetical protein